MVLSTRTLCERIMNPLPVRDYDVALFLSMMESYPR
jgi:hypothetical protein